MSDLAGILWDDDAIYIDMPDKKEARRGNQQGKRARKRDDKEEEEGQSDDDGESRASLTDAEEPDLILDDGTRMMTRLQKGKTNSIEAKNILQHSLFKEGTVVPSDAFKGKDQEEVEAGVVVDRERGDATAEHYSDWSGSDSGLQRHPRGAQGSAKLSTLETKKAAKRRQFEAELDGVKDSDDDGQEEGMGMSEAGSEDTPDREDNTPRARSGAYVRIAITGIPCEFMLNRDPRSAVILGGITQGESAFATCQAVIKKHRWSPKILKSDEPLIMSIGWRRFQTIPVYSMEDYGTRQRFIKYTPEHLHCYAHFYGPVYEQGTPLLAFRSVAEGQSAFRVSATGTMKPAEWTSYAQGSSGRGWQGPEGH